MSKPRPPRPELEWTLADIPEEAAGQAMPRTERPAPQPRRRWRVTWRGVVLALLAISGAALGAWLAARQGWAQLRDQVAQEAAYEDAQSLAGAVDVVVAMQADDAAWRQTRAAEVAQGLPAPLPAAHLQPSTEPPTLTDLRLVADNVFEAELQRTYIDAAGARYVFDYMQRYRNLGPGLWERLRPDSGPFTAHTAWQGERVRANFPPSDTALFQSLLAELDRNLIAACAIWQCPRWRVVTVDVAGLRADDALRPTRPTWEPAAGRAPYPATFDLLPPAELEPGTSLIRLPPPLSAGRPHDATAQHAMLHALTVQALLALASPRVIPNHRGDDFTAALVARAEVRLGLAAPLEYTPSPETYRAPQSLWTLRPPDAATRLADQQQALALLDYALAGQPASVDGALLATLPTATNPATWLGAATGQPGPDLLRAWAALVEPLLEAATTLPREALNGLAYRCGARTALERSADTLPVAIKNNWVALQPEAVSADGRYFAAIERLNPLHIDLRLIDLKTGEGRTVDGAGNIIILGWTADGRLLYQRQEDVTQADEAALLAQLDPATGAWGPWLSQVVIPKYPLPVWWQPDHTALYLPINLGGVGTPGVYVVGRAAVAGDGTLETTSFVPLRSQLAPDGRWVVGVSPTDDNTLDGLALLGLTTRPPARW